MQAVRLDVRDHHVVMDNGILRATLSKPDGIVTAVKYSHIDNLLEIANEESNRGYWDFVWSPQGSSGTTGTFEVIRGTNFHVVVETDEHTKEFVMLRGSSGFYSYAIYEHLEEWPGFNLDETRIVFKLRKDKFRYMAMSDNRQRYMPLPDDRSHDRCQPLDYSEAVLMVNPIEPEFKGEVDDKYQYSGDNKDVKVHGWICEGPNPIVGFWVITPSNEFRTGGPTKQDLTSHVGPITLSMFVSAHYGGEDLVVRLGEGEAWKKVFGPVFVYLNSAVQGANPLSLWEDAKLQVAEQVERWPYSFPASPDFPSSAERGNVSGTLLVKDSDRGQRHDRCTLGYNRVHRLWAKTRSLHTIGHDSSEKCMSDGCIMANGAYIGLAPPGDIGSWQTEGKGYQFWTRADEKGYFSIKKIRSGDYNLYAWVPGFIGDFRHEELITITPGCYIDMDRVVYEPPRDGPTLWDIGIPDRSAREFYVPDPSPKYINKLYVDHPDRFRQYGLRERYAELYPNGDLVYIVGESNYATDWFFAQVTRKKEDNTYISTTWQIKFKLEAVKSNATYKLRLALASAAQAELQVRINHPNQIPPLFTTGLIGKDNAIARHGIHGHYWLFNVGLPGTSLVNGTNTIYLTQSNAIGPFQGVMYDYIRLEGPK
ncbi:hypothetical protein OROHE_020546 [Orobanche hederae]